MPISVSLSNFLRDVAQCDSLLSSAHAVHASGNLIFSQRDREQITVAAFLNLFIAWEEFLEAAFNDFMLGDRTLGGTLPVRFVFPVSRVHSSGLMLHLNRFFDYSSHDYVRKIAKLYFENGYPFESAISALNSDLSDIKTIRNACAHLSSTTRSALEGLAGRILGQPQPGISVYDLLISIDPGSSGQNATVYESFRDKLIAAATMIANG